MPDNEINIVVTATDKASQNLRNVQMSVITLNQAMQLASRVMRVMNDAYEQTIKVALDYSDQVRQLSLVNGTNAKETSKLIQVTDDYKITVEQLTMATRKLAGEGKSLTVDTLAKMSDEYLKLGSSAEKTKFLLDNFGRTGMAFAEIMNKGADAIRNESAAISSNLILTEKQLAETRKLQFAQDEFNDSWEATKVGVGMKAIPVLNVALANLNGMMNGTLTLAEANGIALSYLAPSFFGAAQAADAFSEAQMAAQKMSSAGWEDAGDGVREYARKYDLVKQQIESINGMIDPGQTMAIENAKHMLGLMSDEAYEAAQQARAIKEAIDSIKDKSVRIAVYMSQATRDDTYIPSTPAPPSPGPGYTPPPREVMASGGSVSPGSYALIGDSPSGPTPFSEIAYFPQGGYVFNANQSRSLNRGSMPRAFMGGSIPQASNETDLSDNTIRRLGNVIADAIARRNG